MRRTAGKDIGIGASTATGSVIEDMLAFRLENLGGGGRGTVTRSGQGQEISLRACIKPDIGVRVSATTTTHFDSLDVHAASCCQKFGNITLIWKPWCVPGRVHSELNR